MKRRCTRRIGLSLSVALALAACTGTHTSFNDKPVIDVNGHALSARGFAEELAYRLKDRDALSAKDPKVVHATKAQIGQDFVVQSLSEDWAREKHLVVRAEDLETEIKAVQTSYPDDLSFRQALAEEGTTFAKWKERLQASALQKLVTRQIAPQSTPPTDADLQTYYNQHRAQFTVRETAQVRQILVATESDAKMIEEQLKKGKKMADLAKRYSISPEADKGGMVGWLEKDTSEVFDPAFRMKLGTQSPIVKSEFGYHIFEVTGRLPAHAKTFAEVRAEVKRILVEKREQSAYLAWLEEQVRKARVFKDQAFLDGLQVETKIQ